MAEVHDFLLRMGNGPGRLGWISWSTRGWPSSGRHAQRRKNAAMKATAAAAQEPEAALCAAGSADAAALARPTNSIGNEDAAAADDPAAQREANQSFRRRRKRMRPSFIEIVETDTNVELKTKLLAITAGAMGQRGAGVPDGPFPHQALTNSVPSPAAPRQGSKFVLVVSTATASKRARPTPARPTFAGAVGATLDRRVWIASPSYRGTCTCLLAWQGGQPLEDDGRLRGPGLECVETDESGADRLQRGL